MIFVINLLDYWLFTIKDLELIIPILITDKNDKIYWYNMTWENIKNKALILFEKVSYDIENDNFIEF